MSKPKSKWGRTYGENKIENNIHKPKTIKEAIDDLQEFFECDMWYAKRAEWKTERAMLKYLRGHFAILQGQVKELLQEEVDKTPTK